MVGGSKRATGKGEAQAEPREQGRNIQRQIRTKMEGRPSPKLRRLPLPLNNAKTNPLYIHYIRDDAKDARGGKRKRPKGGNG